MKYLLLLFLLPFFSNEFAQERLTVDELFIKARNAAFELKDRNQARELCHEILKKSPDYTDVSVFLARLYTWDEMYDSARIVFNGIFTKDSSNYDAISAAIDLEFWTDNYQEALHYCNLGLEKYPKSEEFLLKKSKVLADLKNYDDAFAAIETLLSINNTNSDAIIFAERLKEEVRVNAITLSYEYDKFNQIFDPWQLASIAYSRRTPIGTAIIRANFARRFDSNGQQFEMDMYPRFADGFYSYLNLGYSNVSIFPKSRYGFSLYYSLPLSLEIDAGFRLLKYSSDTWIYTAALGKYYSNFWFSFRTYITPSVETASHSYSLIIRYYLSGADDYFAVSGSTGITPDANSVDNNYNWLKTNSGQIEYQSKISKTFILDLSCEYSNEQQTYGAFIDDISGSVSLKFLF
jgi:YaiO family outer membrane protein